MLAAREKNWNLITMNSVMSEDGNNPHISFGSGNSELQNAEPLRSIGEMAKHYQVTLRTLRFYEHSGLLKPIRRGKTRLYCAKDCRRLELVLRGKQLGFSIAEIHKLILSSNDSFEASNLDSILTPAQLTRHMSNLQRQRDELDKTISALLDIHRKLSEL
jgi:DNA-binding transcriptional MerR regulator